VTLLGYDRAIRASHCTAAARKLKIRHHIVIHALLVAYEVVALDGDIVAASPTKLCLYRSDQLVVRLTFE
jgi:hypothetical protein